MTLLDDAITCQFELPNWVPEAAKHYLFHTEVGVSIRALARQKGCHASTVLRQVRRFENRRDDPLVDEALESLKAHFTSETQQSDEDPAAMTAHLRSHAHLPQVKTPDEKTVENEARRILRRLCETGAVLALAGDMPNAVVVRDLPGGQSTRTAVVERSIAQAMALKDWISIRASGRVTRYEITNAGRSALKRMLSEHAIRTGRKEPTDVFGDQHRIWAEKQVQQGSGEAPKRMRYNLAESPLASLARRKDKNGEAFLNDELVAAGERLREDFELAQMGPRVAQDWDKFMTGGAGSSFSGDGGMGEGPTAARARVDQALRELGDGLADVVLRCCCFLEGMETAEKRMGWSARSGKIVLRIALQRLKLHYDSQNGGRSPLIG